MGLLQNSTYYRIEGDQRYYGEEQSVDINVHGYSSRETIDKGHTEYFGIRVPFTEFGTNEPTLAQLYAYLKANGRLYSAADVFEPAKSFEKPARVTEEEPAKQTLLQKLWAKIA